MRLQCAYLIQLCGWRWPGGRGKLVGPQLQAHIKWPEQFEAGMLFIEEPVWQRALAQAAAGVGLHMDEGLPVNGWTLALSKHLVMLGAAAEEYACEVAEVPLKGRALRGRPLFSLNQ